MTKASVRSFYSGSTDKATWSGVILTAYIQQQSTNKQRTYKLCKLFVADAAMSFLEVLGVQHTAICVDITEADGCQHLH